MDREIQAIESGRFFLHLPCSLFASAVSCHSVVHCLQSQVGVGVIGLGTVSFTKLLQITNIVTSNFNLGIEMQKLQEAEVNILFLIKLII